MFVEGASTAFTGSIESIPFEIGRELEKAMVATGTVTLWQQT